MRASSASSLQLEARRHHVWGDAARLQQVLWNLLRNAIKFTPEAGSITVADAQPRRGGGIEVSVADTGRRHRPGEPPRHLQRLRAGRGATSPAGSAAWAWAWRSARRSSRLHGGTIRADSEGQDQGATFTITLPVTTAPASATAAAPGAAAAGPTATTRPGRLAAARPARRGQPRDARGHEPLFRDFGYEVTAGRRHRRRPETAAQAKQFDLVVSDLGLPDGNGLELMRQLRDQYGPPRHRPLRLRQEEDVRESRDAGFVEHLIKPVDFARLEAAVRRVTANS